MNIHMLSQVDSLVEGADFSVTLSRSKFESLNKAFFDKIQTTVKNVLADAKLKNDDVAEIVLVGGSSRFVCLLAVVSSGE